MVRTKKTATETAAEIAARTTTTATSTAATMTKKSARSLPAPTKKAIDTFSDPSTTDVNGSYTGRPKNKREIPVQDADDL